MYTKLPPPFSYLFGLKDLGKNSFKIQYLICSLIICDFIVHLH